MFRPEADAETMLALISTGWSWQGVPRQLRSK
jgi:hypothetical protein